MRHKRTPLVIVFALAALALTEAASAGNSAHPMLDAAAVTISGDATLLTYCENDQAEWDRWVALADKPPGEVVRGFTFRLNFDPLTGGHFVYVSPRTCSLLRAFADGIPPDLRSSFPYEEVGGAILVLTHEAVHVRLHLGNEALVECNAMKMLPWVIQTVFKVPPTVLQTRRVRVRVKRHGKMVRVWRVRISRVTNLDYAALMTGAILLDSAAPAEYHGATC